MVPFQSIIFMCITLGFVILASIILPIIIKKKWQTAVYPYFLGWAIFLIFALILESGMHLLVLRSTGDTITGNKWLYALYGGFAAGIFEETGRFLAMKLFMKKLHDAPHNALMYGAGHGCFEALALVGIGMAGNLVMSVLINSGQTGMLLSTVPPEQQETMQTTFTTLKETASYMFLLSGFERITAILLHLSFSVLVWIAVVKKKPAFFLLAILLHALPDGVVVILQMSKVNSFLLEGVLVGTAVAIAIFAYMMWKKHLRTPVSEPAF